MSRVIANAYRHTAASADAITLDSSGNVTGATTSDSLTDPINYFYIQSTSSATTGGVSGGGDNCSAGPVTLEVVNG